jgi:ParB family chromosome partitioning protein
MGKTSSSGTTATATPVSIANHRGRVKAGPESTNAEPAYQLIAIELIDEPDRAIRETFDEVQLQELCDSIMAVGLLEPLVVEQHGARFKVMAGHRRLIACQAVKLARVPCIVRQPGQVDPAAVTIAENYYRESVNPAEEAVFLDRLLNERCNGDTDVLAALIRHKREYVEDRILLVRGDPKILDALKNRQITLAVARELQKVRIDDQRMVFLDAAIRGGATAAIVRNWRAQGELVPPSEPAPAPADETAIAAPAPAAAPQMQCFFCGGTEDPHAMQMLWVHSYCNRAVQRSLNVAQDDVTPKG